MPRLSFCSTGGLMVGRHTHGELSDLSLLEPPVGRRRGLRPRSGDLEGDPERDDGLRSMPMLLSAALAMVSATLSWCACRDGVTCHLCLELVVVDVALLESDDAVVMEAFDALREGWLGRALSSLVEEDAEPDRDRSGVAALDSWALAVAALAFSRMDSSSRLLPWPGGVVRSAPSMRICGGDRLPSRLDGGVSVTGCGMGSGFGSLSSCGGGM